VTITEWHRSSAYAGNYAAGWVVSMLLHGSLAVGAVFFVQQVQLAPQLDPFKWDVTLVSSVSSRIPSSPLASPAESLPSVHSTTLATRDQEQPAQPVLKATKSESVEPKPPLMTVTAQPAPLPQADSLAAESITHTPAPVDSESPSHKPDHSEPSWISSQNTSDSTMIATTLAHPEPPTSDSSDASASPEPATSIASHVTTPPAETSVPAASSATQIAALTSTGANRPVRADYGWLSEVILRRVEELKHYPAEARADRAEGKVVVKAVINEDGSVENVEIFQSSGSATLDRAAVDLMRSAAPFSLPHSLEKPHVTVKIPMNYRLDR
jgi:protein TonB